MYGRGLRSNAGGWSSDDSYPREVVQDTCRPHGCSSAKESHDEHLARAAKGHCKKRSTIRPVIIDGAPGLLLSVIAEHMRQHLGVEDAARR